MTGDAPRRGPLAFGALICAVWGSLAWWLL